MASPMGCKNPIKDTLLGPNRNPTSLSNFRSSKVKKAIQIKGGNNKKRNLIKKTKFKNRRWNLIKILNFIH